MKKLALASICTLTTLTAAFAGTNNPMDNYTPTVVSESNLDRLWSEMRTDLKGKDCYRRAQLWTYDMYKNHSIDSRKIFIHYTDKFNRELDNLGREGGLSWLSRKTLKIDGVHDRVIRMIRSNITWDYHVAPMLNVDGKDMVMDKYLDLPYAATGHFPYTHEEAWSINKSARPATPEEWVEALTVRGELLWKARRQELRNDIQEYKEKYYKVKSESRKKKFRKLYREAQSTYKRLGMDQAKEIDIKCRKITSMVELDRNQMNEWCFYSETPMYYYNEIDLRNLAYGRIPGLNYAQAVDPIHATQANFENGRDYIQTKFNEKELEDAEGEIKTDSDEQKAREEEEKRLKEAKKAEEKRLKEERKAKKRAEREARRARRNN